MLLDSAWLSLGYVRFSRLPEGISFRGKAVPADIHFVYDLSYVDESGQRQLSQRIFDELFTLIGNASQLLVIDQFLFHDYPASTPGASRPLARELTDALLQRKRECPQLAIYFITDPVSSMYGGVLNPYLADLEAAGVTVAVTDLDQLRDSNPIYSFFWRLLVRPFGNKPGGIFRNPLNDERVSLRSYLAMMNQKANHRKSVVADDGAGNWVGYVATANPHDASSAHMNAALRFTGPAVRDLYQTELAVLTMLNIEPPAIPVEPLPVSSSVNLTVLTEKMVKRALLEVISSALDGDNLEIIMLYLSDRVVIDALHAASSRGANVRIILDANVDSFGMKKAGIPNAPVASDLVQRGVLVRWANTTGEQCHTKLMIKQNQARSTLIVGSANFTRRSLENFNLETNVLAEGPVDAPGLDAAHRTFEVLWDNSHGRTYTVPYEHHGGRKFWRYLLYWLMEVTGISTF